MRGPSADDIERGSKFGFQIDRNRAFSGKILGGDGTVRWRYETRPKEHFFSPFLFRKPDFFMMDREGNEVFQIRRISSLPARFAMIQENQVVAMIVRRSILRNKYSLELRDGPEWIFRMPLFTISFWGESGEGRRFWVRVGPSSMEWSLLLQPGTEDARLIAGLAFIHRYRWCYG